MQQLWREGKSQCYYSGSTLALEYNFIQLNFDHETPNPHPSVPDDALISSRIKGN